MYDLLLLLLLLYSNSIDDTSWSTSTLVTSVCVLVSFLSTWWSIYFSSYAHWRLCMVWTSTTTPICISSDCYTYSQLSVWPVLLFFLLVVSCYFCQISAIRFHVGNISNSGLGLSPLHNVIYCCLHVCGLLLLLSTVIAVAVTNIHFCLSDWNIFCASESMCPISSWLFPTWDWGEVITCICMSESMCRTLERVEL